MAGKDGRPMARLFFAKPKSSGGRIGFYKHVTSVDRTKKTAWAFRGTFLQGEIEEDFPVGDVLVRKTPGGSSKNNSGLDTWEYTFIPSEEDTWEWTDKMEGKRFLTFRDQVERAVEQAKLNWEQHKAENPELYATAGDVTTDQSTSPEDRQERNPEDRQERNPEDRQGLEKTGTELDEALETVRQEYRGMIAFDTKKGGFYASGPRPGAKIRASLERANTVLETVRKILPHGLGGAIRWNGRHMTLTLDREEIFRTNHGMELNHAQSMIQDANSARESNGSKETGYEPVILSTVRRALEDAQKHEEENRAGLTQQIQAAAGDAGFSVEDDPDQENTVALVPQEN